MLNGLICLFFSFSLIFLILKNKRKRTISVILTSIGVIVGILLFIKSTNVPLVTEQSIEFENTIIDAQIYDQNIANCYISDDGKTVYIYHIKNR